MKVKTIKRFHDMKEKKIREVNAVFEVSDQRAEYLIGQGMVRKLTSEEEKEQVAEKETKPTKNVVKG